jgi:CelD/BcsL family acetyltransferase involved in cellulose biosynthesis
MLARERRLILQVVTEEAVFADLRDEWDGLCLRAADRHFFHRFTWCWHVWKEVASKRGRGLHIVIGREQGRVVVIWPLMIDGRTLRLMSSDTLEYRDVIVEAGPDEEARVRASWRFIRRCGAADVFHFQNLREPSPIRRFLIGSRGFLAVGGGWCPVIRLDRDADADTFMKGLPKALVADQRRQWMRAGEALPGLVFVRVANRPDIEATISWIMQHKVRWLESRDKVAPVFRSGAMHRLLTGVALEAHQRGQLLMGKLCNDQHVISAGFGYKCGDEFLFHVFAYDEAWSRLSPSRLFLEQLVRTCFDEGVSLFDFMPGDEQYKTVWANDLVRTDSCAGPLSLAGALLLRWRLRESRHSPLGAYVRRVYKRLPGFLRNGRWARMVRASLPALEFRERPPIPRLVRGQAGASAAAHRSRTTASAEAGDSGK